MPPALPDSYTTLTLPHIRLAHHPSSSPTVTPVIIIYLDRPKARNAFTTPMSQSLVQAADLLSSDPRVRAIVLASSDPSNRSFCVGMDLTGDAGDADALRQGSRDAYRDPGGRTALAFHRCDKPIIAAINGDAVGVGATMTLPASIRIASSSARLGFVFARRGIVLEACSSFFLPRLVGTSRALHLVTTGGVYPATSPLFGDLFSEVVAPDQVLPRALVIAEEVAAKVSGVSAKLNREMIYRGAASPEEAHLLESALFYDLIKGRDSMEGMVSFMQKRDPAFEGTMTDDAPSIYPWWQETDLKPKI
ncbi:enoyl-CoA hydratase [Plectosphaerella cucumerina]|uniref:Enoyl-CoA hydratase n=1 Tax=Plectosphaerella cucumerina TaxID=40658 RepID=A0A8K0TQI5_9PEZI|nr:enoyl-CoA hydratase [Plectosphaerella cucumerina]